MDELKDQMVSFVVARTGIDASMVNRVVDAVLDFVREDPSRIARLAGGDGLEELKEGLGKLFG